MDYLEQQLVPQLWCNGTILFKLCSFLNSFSDSGSYTLFWFVLVNCSENTGLLGLTKVGSRRVVQISAGFMIFFSIFGNAQTREVTPKQLVFVFCNQLLNLVKNREVWGCSCIDTITDLCSCVLCSIRLCWYV